MYLESIKITNYRKFGRNNNLINFVMPSEMEPDKDASIIAPSSTLIIGKNNAGKTTIANAIKFICEAPQPTATDFNIYYLNDLFKQYLSVYSSDKPLTAENCQIPEIEFSLNVMIQVNKSDLINNISKFLPINSKDGELRNATIKIIVSISEVEYYLNSVAEILKENKTEKEKMTLFIRLLNGEDVYTKNEKKLYKHNYFGINDAPVNGFALRSLIEIKEVKANRHLKENVLSEIYNKIIKFQFENNDVTKRELELEIENINKQITEKVESKGKSVSDVLSQVENVNNIGLSLTGNVTYDSILNSLIKYNFSDGENFIPEDQFGLGYINLINIIGEIIHYIDSYKNGSHKSRINLLFIEEPEAFMHPQMQEFFINRIDNAVKKALENAKSIEGGQDLSLYCQIAITTHSSHIVNSKIHSSNSFNNINYLTSNKNISEVYLLNDSKIVDENSKDSDLVFIKKHIKYKVSELFFSDAVIFVEGTTEESILKNYIEHDDILKNFYISVFNINGAHGKVYIPLIKQLSIPCLIITDLDIKRYDCEKNERHSKYENCSKCGQVSHKGLKISNPGQSPDFKQIYTLFNRVTTNKTISALIGTDKLRNLDYVKDKNLLVVFQKDKIKGVFSTSLEEALILTNYSNVVVNKAIETTIPKIYSSIVGSDINLNNVLKNSYKIQSKLSTSSKKGEFSSNLIYELLTNDEKNRPTLPRYILEGFHWLKRQLSNDIHQGES